MKLSKMHQSNLIFSLPIVKRTSDQLIIENENIIRYEKVNKNQKNSPTVIKIFITYFFFFFNNNEKSICIMKIGRVTGIYLDMWFPNKRLWQSMGKSRCHGLTRWQQQGVDAAYASVRYITIYPIFPQYFPEDWKSTCPRQEKKYISMPMEKALNSKNHNDIEKKIYKKKYSMPHFSWFYYKFFFIFFFVWTSKWLPTGWLHTWCDLLHYLFLFTSKNFHGPSKYLWAWVNFCNFSFFTKWLFSTLILLCILL